MVLTGQTKRKYRVLLVAAEVAPFVSVGGLSQVMYFLPRSLLKLGVDVRVFMPRFGKIDEKEWGLRMHTEGLRVPTDDKKGAPELICNVKEYRGTKTNPTVYFLENMEYYEKRANVYGYSDDHIRFALLSRGALEFVRQTRDWVPNLIHANDWHVGYLPNYLRTGYEDAAKLRRLAVLFSIHNLHLQGNFDFRYASALDYDDGKGNLAPLFANRLQQQNPMKRGIIYADVVNTVSESYSREMMTEELGEGLDGLLSEVRTKVYGVLNGLDYEEYDPLTDKIIKVNYGVNSLADRYENKVDLQREFNLPVKELPVMAITGRLDQQKGLDLVKEVMPRLLAEYDLQFIVMGGGEQHYREFFDRLQKEYPAKVGTHLMPNFTLPRKIFAGVDMLLMPSKFEPGGIVAIEAMRYGAIPIVRATGGLADSVQNFDPLANTGIGFAFQCYSSWSFYGALIRALEIYKQPKIWRGIQRRAMKADLSWDKAAEKYLDLYERAIDYRTETLSPKPHQAYRQMMF